MSKEQSENDATLLKIAELENASAQWELIEPYYDKQSDRAVNAMRIILLGFVFLSGSAAGWVLANWMIGG